MASKREPEFPGTLTAEYLGQLRRRKLIRLLDQAGVSYPDSAQNETLIQILLLREQRVPGSITSLLTQAEPELEKEASALEERRPLEASDAQAVHDLRTLPRISKREDLTAEKAAEIFRLLDSVSVEMAKAVEPGLTQASIFAHLRGVKDTFHEYCATQGLEGYLPKESVGSV